MIVLDVETSGLSFSKCGLWQIGAIDLVSGDEFVQEARIDDEDEVQEGALKVIGKTEEELRDKNKQSQRDLIAKFLKWLENKESKNFICQNPQFDLGWMIFRMEKYGFEKAFPHRAFDLHTVAQMKFKEVNGNFLMKDKDGKKQSDMNLKRILEFCGIPDERVYVRNEEVLQEGKPHDALDDCKLEGECFSRLVYGQKVFPEFEKYEIPGGLAK